MYFNFDADINTPPFRFRIHNKTVQALIADMFIVSGFFTLLNRHVTWILIIGIVLDLLMLADLLYMRYYKNPLTISVILHNIKVMKEARESVADVLKVKDLIYIIDIPLFIIMLLTLNNGSMYNKQRLIFSLLLLIIGIVWLTYIYFKSNRAPYKWNRKRIARDLGILFYHVTDILIYIKDCFTKKHKLSLEQKKEIKNSFCILQQNKYTNTCKDKNLIVVQMEAMQDFLVNMKIAGKEVTPNLNQLMRENIRFTNMFFQTSVANTSDAEVLSNNALFPLLDKPTCYELQTNQFYSLATRMREKGYRALAFHGNQASTWNRYLVYRQYGYEKFIDNKILKNDDIIYLGLSDHSFFQQSIDMLLQQCNSDKFLSFLITLSQHHPYHQFSNYPFDVAEYEGTMFGNYLKGAHYADKAIGELIQNLKKTGLYDNSVLLMYGDHSGIPELYYDNSLKTKKMGQHDINWLKHQKVAAMLHLPKSIDNMEQSFKNHIIDKVVGQIDILPTICNLFDLPSAYLLGEDMLNPQNIGKVILRDGTVITNNYIHYLQEDTAYDWFQNKVELTEEMKSVIGTMEQRLNISDLILERNAIHFLKS